MNCITTNDHVLAKVLSTCKTVIVWYRWLIDRPVIEWWVNDWVGMGCVGLYEVVAVDAVDDDIAEFEILITFVSGVVWWRWLVDGPVVKWWVPYWILSGNLSISLEKIEVFSLDANL
jgi:hypothetical protein